MHLSDLHIQLHIGQRNIKSALAATLCALLYFVIGRNPTFACIGAIFGMGSDMGNSRLNGGNRFFGTIIGGVLGMLLFIGVVVLILVSQTFHWPGAVQPGGVVLCIILFNTPVETYISYSIWRMIDTGVGVAIALLINYLLPRERVIRFFEAAHMRKRASAK